MRVMNFCINIAEDNNSTVEF